MKSEKFDDDDDDNDNDNDNNDNNNNNNNNNNNKLTARNKITAIVALAVPVLRYSFGIINWRIEEIKKKRQEN